MRTHGIGFACLAPAKSCSFWISSLVRAGFPSSGWALRADDRVAAHAGADRRQARIGRLVRGVVAVQAVHPELLHVDGMREVDRLNGATPCDDEAPLYAERIVAARTIAKKPGTRAQFRESLIRPSLRVF